MELRTDRYKLKEIFPERAKKYAQKLHVKADEIEYVRKGIPIDPADITIEEGERAAIRLITTPRLDRDGEILLPDGAILDDFRQSPSVLFSHKYDTLPIGKDVWIKPVKKGILAKTVYASHQFAEDAFQCVKGGFLNSNSVGFIPIEHIRQDDARFKDLVDRLEKEYGVPREEAETAKAIYTKWLLLEHSDVPVASNAQSLNLAVSKGELILDSKSMKEELGIEVDPAPVPEVHTTICEKDTDAPPVMPETKVKTEIVTKPETTENYHRIPISTGHEGHRIRTITISAEKGIKALYCGECKKVVTYLFDVDKFTMAEAEAWVEDHKKDISDLMKEPFMADYPEGQDMDYEILDFQNIPVIHVKDAKQEHRVFREVKQAPAPAPPDISAEIASLRQDVAAILARLPVTPVPGPAPAPAEDIIIEASPEIVIEPTAPDKTAEVLIDEYIRSIDYKKAVAEAIEVALAKVRGRVI